MNTQTQELLTTASSSISIFLEKVTADIADIYLYSFKYNKKIQFTEVFKTSHEYKDDNNSFVYVGNIDNDNEHKLTFSSTYVEGYAIYTLCNLYKQLYDMRFIYWYLSHIEKDAGRMYFSDRSYMFDKIEFVRIPVISIDKQLEIIAKIDKLKYISDSITESLDAFHHLYS